MAKKKVKCKGIRTDGEPCNAIALKNGYCRSHKEQSPDFPVKKSLKEQQEDYHNYLKSPEWAVKRKIVLSVLGETCKLCGKKATTIHHNTYRTLYKENLLKDLTVLCPDCHAWYHGKGKYDGNKTRRK